MKADWMALFLAARKLLEEEARRHAVSCGCRDAGDPLVEGPCPGVVEREEFLKNTANVVPGER